MMNIDQMPAGREMDLLIINAIPDLMPEPWKGGNSTFTYKIERLKDGPIDIFDGGESMTEAEDGEPYIIWVRDDGNEGIEEPLPHYSTDIADAWKVVEKMKQLFWECDIFYGSKMPGCSCVFYETLNTKAYQENHLFAETAPLAICRASLKAVGVEI